MKNLFILLSLLLCTYLSTAQEDTTPLANDWLIGGSVEFRDQDNSFSQSRFLLAPYIGKYLNSNLILGGGISYGRMRQNDLNFIQTGGEIITTSSTNNNFGANLFLRYLVNPGNKLNFYFQPRISASFGSTVIENPIVEVIDNDTSSFGLGLGAGLQYTVNNRWIIRINFGSISYNRFSTKQNGIDDIVTNSFFADFDLSFNNIALEYRF